MLRPAIQSNWTHANTSSITDRQSCIHTYIHTYLLTYLHTDIHSNIHTYIHTYTYAYTYTYIQSNLDARELAQQHRDTEVVETLLRARADVHLKNTYGRTALHYAAMEGNLSACRLLVEHGSLPDELDTHGFTPVQHACLMKRADWDFCHDFLIEVMVNKPSEEELAAMLGKKGQKGKKGKGKGKKKKK